MLPAPDDRPATVADVADPDALSPSHEQALRALHARVMRDCADAEVHFAAVKDRTTQTRIDAVVKRDGLQIWAARMAYTRGRDHDARAHKLAREFADRWRTLRSPAHEVAELDRAYGLATDHLQRSLDALGDASRDLADRLVAALNAHGAKTIPEASLGVVDGRLGVAWPSVAEHVRWALALADIAAKHPGLLYMMREAKAQIERRQIQLKHIERRRDALKEDRRA